MTKQCPFCQTPLSEHEAGRETDVCIAKRSGWTHQILKHNGVDYVYLTDEKGKTKYSMPVTHTNMDTLYINRVPHYSTDMNEAMKLWNGIFHHGTQSHLTRMGTGKNITYKLVMPQMYRTDYFPIATTPALAICRAYLIEKMKEKSK